MTDVHKIVKVGGICGFGQSGTITSDSGETHIVKNLQLSSGTFSGSSLTGKRMVFGQASAPLGWTKDTSASMDRAMMVAQIGTATTIGGSQIVLSHSQTMSGHTHAYSSHSHTNQVVSGTFDEHNHGITWDWRKLKNDAGGTRSGSLVRLRVSFDGTDDPSITRNEGETVEFNPTAPTGSGGGGNTAAPSPSTTSTPTNDSGAIRTIKYHHVIVCTKD